MAAKKLFKGLAHNIAHHSECSLSWLHPHLGEAAAAAGMSKVTLNLLDGQLLPNEISTTKALELAIPAWRERFREMATKIGLDVGRLSSAKVEFDFSNWRDLSSGDATSELILKDGTKYTWRPAAPRPPEHKIPGTDLYWPDAFIKRNEKYLRKKD